MTSHTRDHADSLSDLLKSVEGRVQVYHDERRALVVQLEDMRRTVEKLLSSLTEPTPRRGRGRPRSSSARPGVRTGAKLSAATRKKMSEAARARWAIRKAGGKKNG